MAVKNAVILQNDNGTTTTAIQIDTASTVNSVPMSVDAVGNVAFSKSVAASAVVTSAGLFEMANTISANYTIANGNNGISAGPITISDGVTVTIPTGSRWIVV
jgi:hypothetical protein